MPDPSYFYGVEIKSIDTYFKKWRHLSPGELYNM